MSANPTSGWDGVNIHGLWMNIDQTTPKQGSVVFTLLSPTRIVRTNGSVIFPRGGKLTATLAAGAISLTFPANDDPDILQHGWQVKVQENFTDGSGETYVITPTLADVAGGINLALVDAPAVPVDQQLTSGLVQAVADLATRVIGYTDNGDGTVTFA